MPALTDGAAFDERRVLGPRHSRIFCDKITCRSIIEAHNGRLWANLTCDVALSFASLHLLIRPRRPECSAASILNEAGVESSRPSMEVTLSRAWLLVGGLAHE
jgi:hypothetical protein